MSVSISHCVLLSAILLSPLACAPIDVVTRHDSHASFSSYKTFQLLQNQQKDLSDIKLAMTQDVFDNALEQAFATTLTASGFVKTDQAADFIVTYYVAVSTSSTVVEVKNYYRNVGYSYTGQLMTESYGTDQKVVSYQIGSLFIDIFDAKSKKSVWQGSAKTPIGLHTEKDKQIERINTVVDKILKKFPPK